MAVHCRIKKKDEIGRRLIIRRKRWVTFCKKKDKNNIIIMSQNVNRIGQLEGSLKEHNLKVFAIERSVNVLGVQ